MTSSTKIIYRLNSLVLKRWKCNIVSAIPSKYPVKPAHNTFQPSISPEAVFTARCYASAVLAMALCPSVCLSVRHKSQFYYNGWTNRARFGMELHSTYPTLCHKEIHVPSKITVLPFWNFVLNSGLRKFCHGISIVEACYQLSSRKVDAQSVIDWAVVGQLSR